MILNDRELRELGPELLEPFDADNVQPASIDVRLSNKFRVFDNSRVPYIDLGDPSTYENLTTPTEVPIETGFTLHPGEFVLGATEEIIHMPDDLVSRIEGKSSLGRLGLLVHATAGFIDPGFTGRITLEMANLLRVPIVLRPGRLIAQLSFERMGEAAETPYRGRYQGDLGAAESRYGLEILGGERRNDPSTGNTYVKRGGGDGYVDISDIFGSHEATISTLEWNSWKETN